MSINLRLSIALTVLIVALVACQTKDNVTQTRQLPPSATPMPSLTPTVSSTPTPHPSATATSIPPSSTPSPWPTPTPFAPKVTLEIIGQIGGWAKAVAGKDDSAYLGVGPQVLVLDVSDPSAPRQIRQTGILSDVVNDIAVVDNLLYIAANKAGLHILDVSDPTSPREIGLVLPKLSAHQVIVQENVAFVAESQSYFRDRQDILRLIDVTDPTMPREITWLEGQIVGVQGDYAYVNQGEALQVVDISDPQTIRRIANTGLQNVSAVAGGYAYTINHLRGNDVISDVLGLVDISDPSQPQELGSLELGLARIETLDSVIVIDDSFVCAISIFNGESAYTASTLHLVDVSNPTEPRLVASWGPESDTSWKSGAVADKILVDGLLYLAVSDTYANNGLWIVDVSNPTKPRKTGTFNVLGIAHDVVGTGEYAYVTSGYFPDYLNLIDVTDLSNIQDRGIVLSVRWGQMALVDGYLYLPGYTSLEESVHVLDVTDPDNPQKLDWDASNLGDFFYLSAADDYACVATTNHSLRFFDLTNPSRPRQVSRLDTEGIRQVVCAEDHAYYVSTKYDDDLSTLHVVDVSDLTKPQESSTINLPEYARDIAFADGHLYVIADCDQSCQGSELLVIDVSDKAHPRQAGSLSGALDSSMADMGLMDHYAYIVDGDVWIMDISDPAEPRPIGYMDTLGYANGITITDDTLLVADGGGGLVVVRVRD